jgi:hypothetical protein
MSLTTDAMVNAAELPDDAEVDVRVTARLNKESGVLEVTHVVADIMTDDGRAIGRAERSAFGNTGCVWSLLLVHFEWTYVNPAYSAAEAAALAGRKEPRREE